MKIGCPKKVPEIGAFLSDTPKGNIVDYDAPRPSEPKLKDVLNGLDI